MDNISLCLFRCVLAGKLYLNVTSATRIYFDSETAVGKVEFDRQAILLLVDIGIVNNWVLKICHVILLSDCQVLIQTNQGLHQK